MNEQRFLAAKVAALVAVVLAACSPARPQEGELLSARDQAAPQVQTQVAAQPAFPSAAEVAPVIETQVVALPVATAAAFQLAPGAPPLQPFSQDRLIVKNAEIELLVEDSDTALDRTTQVVTDVGGYIISSRVWYQTIRETNYKYATLTMGVPVGEFELALRRLRALAIQVLNESASGEDVTEQFVDLESRLTNLEATRDRIRGFLDQATKVEEALSVNQQLSNVEQQIEEIQGRMNYLSGRAAFSTITVHLEPDILELTPTPTPTSTPTPTPTAWSPAETFGRASDTLGSVYRGLADIAIWFGVVLVPTVGPLALIGFIVWRVTLTRRNRPPSGGSNGA